MNCSQFRQFYSDFADGLLDETEEVAFHVHMAECVACHKFDAALEQGRHALRRLDSPAPSHDFANRLYDRIERENAPPPEPVLRQWSGLASAMLIVAAVGIGGWHARTSHTAAPNRLPARPNARAADPFVPRFAGDTSARYLGRFPVVPVSNDSLRSTARSANSFEISVDWMVP